VRRIVLMLIATLLAVVMMLATAFPAFGASGGTQTPKTNGSGTITEVLTPSGNYNTVNTATGHCHQCY
jgi:hypothetical protein